MFTRRDGAFGLAGVAVGTLLSKVADRLIDRLAEAIVSGAWPVVVGVLAGMLPFLPLAIAGGIIGVFASRNWCYRTERAEDEALRGLSVPAEVVDGRLLLLDGNLYGQVRIANPCSHHLVVQGVVVGQLVVKLGSKIVESLPIMAETRGIKPLGQIVARFTAPALNGIAVGDVASVGILFVVSRHGRRFIQMAQSCEPVKIDAGEPGKGLGAWRV